MTMAGVTASTQPSDSTTVRNTILAGDQAKLPSPPFISVEGVPNVRDLGGHTCLPHGETGGNDTQMTRSTRSNYFFRSAQPAHITSKGIDTLRTELGIHDTYDLRSFKEIRLMSVRYPDLPLDLPGITRHHIPIYKDSDYTPISMAEKYQEGERAEDEPIKDGFVRAYEEILRQAAVSESYRTIMLHILERPDEPLLFHCTVGKDRTGVFAALVLKLCGVSDEAVIWDYALTTHGLGKWREHLIKRIMDGAGTEYANKGAEESKEGPQSKPLPTRKEAERMVGSHAEDMEAFLALLKRKFGGARQYFREYCGFTDVELGQIVGTLTVAGRGLEYSMS